jgi:hypothetical protein
LRAVNKSAHPQERQPMSHPHWELVNVKIQEFRKCLASNFPPLTIRHAFDLMTCGDEWDEGLKSGVWRDSGVYLVFDEDRTLIWVGKAESTFRNRLKSSAKCREGAYSVAIIPFPDEHDCLIPALEKFLIRHLHPKLNIQARLR